MGLALTISGSLILWACLFATDARRPITKRRRSLELKAKKGRLIHVRETESENEL